MTLTKKSFCSTPTEQRFVSHNDLPVATTLPLPSAQPRVAYIGV